MKVRAVLFGVTLLSVLVVATGFAQQSASPGKSVSVQKNDPTHAADQQPGLRTTSQPGDSAPMQNDDPQHLAAQDPTRRTAWQPGKSPFNSTRHH
ncbi:MAG: hypothetical protein L7F78_17715 [Syntrophales bacterium LBB04]|nr:hypothetical protein [Syntrophales bacterium LBB04]